MGILGVRRARNCFRGGAPRIPISGAFGFKGKLSKNLREGMGDPITRDYANSLLLQNPKGWGDLHNLDVIRPLTLPPEVPAPQSGATRPLHPA